MHTTLYTHTIQSEHKNMFTPSDMKKLTDTTHLTFFEDKNLTEEEDVIM